MRIVLVLVLLIGGAIAAAWLGGETWIARETARRIEADPRIEAAAVTPLREIDRIGMQLTDVSVQTPSGDAAIPRLDLWAAPSAPNEFHASLPPEMTVPVAGRGRKVTAQDAELSLRVSPDRNLSRGAGTSGPVTIDGKPLLAGAVFEARLVTMGAGAPRDARARYRLSGQVDRLEPGGLLPAAAALVEQGALSAEGAADVFLTGPVSTTQAESAPRVVGAATDGITLRLGDQVLRVVGSVSAADDGRAQGAAFIYTADARAWLDIAARLGMIPQASVALAGTMLETAATTEVSLPPGVPAPPAPDRGELRIPVVFKDGRTWLGPMALGPAPVFPN